MNKTAISVVVGVVVAVLGGVITTAAQKFAGLPGQVAVLQVQRAEDREWMKRIEGKLDRALGVGRRAP